MVARGDLGVEMGYAELTGIQKRLIEAANTLVVRHRDLDGHGEQVVGSHSREARMLLAKVALGLAQQLLIGAAAADQATITEDRSAHENLAMTLSRLAGRLLRHLAEIVV